MKGQKQLEELLSYVEKYKKTDLSNGVELNLVLQKITSSLPYIETVRDDYKQEHTQLMSQLIIEGKSVSGAKIEADKKIPEADRLRKIVKAIYEVVGAIRTNISYLKQEMNNLNHG